MSISSVRKGIRLTCLLSKFVLGEFNNRRRALFRDLQKGIIGLGSRMATYDYESVTTANGRYLHSLKERGLFPFEDSFEAQSFSDIIEKAAQFPSYRVERCGMRCNCYELKDIDLKVELQRGIEECEKLEPGLCLSCIKAKESSKEESRTCLHL